MLEESLQESRLEVGEAAVGEDDDRPGIQGSLQIIPDLLNLRLQPLLTPPEEIGQFIFPVPSDAIVPVGSNINRWDGQLSAYVQKEW